MEQYPTILDRIFFGSVSSKVLGHLTVMRPLEFTLAELCRILDLSTTTIQSTLDNLKEFELIEQNTTSKKYRIADNDHTNSFVKFHQQLLLWNLDRLTNLTKEQSS